MRLKLLHINDFFSQAMALALILLGCTVMLGWHLKLPLLFQLRADLVPMPYNTALGFLLTGAALLLLAFDKRPWGQVCAYASALIGGMTLIQDMAGVDFHIDQLLMQHYVSTNTSAPGRMAPNTALCLLLSNSALLLASRRKFLWAILASLLVAILSALPLAGYIFSVPSADGWANLTRMAPHTAIGFLILALAIALTYYVQAKTLFDQLSIQARISTVSGIMLSLVLAMGITALAIIDFAFTQSEQLERHAFHASSAAHAMKIDAIEINQNMKLIAMINDKKQEAIALQNIAQQERSFFQQLQIVSEHYPGPEADLNAMKDNFIRWRAHDTESIHRLASGQRDLYNARTMAASHLLNLETQRSADRILNVVFAEAQRLSNEKRATRGAELNLMLIILGGAAIIAITLSIFISRSIRVQLYRLTNTMTDIAHGEAGSMIPYLDDQHEIGHMARSVDIFKGYLTERNRHQARSLQYVESAPAGMVMINRAGFIHMVNQKTEVLFGYTREELIGQPLEILLPVRFRANHPKQRAHFFQSPSIRAMGTFKVLYALHKDGIEFPVEIGLNPIEFEDELLVLASITDITARHEADQALKAASERLQKHAMALERSNQDLDTFAYIASHDLKSPLRGIDQLATWIVEDMGENLSPEVRKHLQLMRSRVNRMENLLNALLAYSRVGRQAYQLIAVDTRQLALGIFNMLSDHERITLTIIDPMPTFVTLQVPLEIVFRNLINNAIKHHDKPYGTITLSATSAPNGHLFTIADDGPGIAPEHQERVFGIFQTLRPRDDIEGSGMGLAIVKKTIEGYGGCITLTSDGHLGSTFQFTWPDEAAIRSHIHEHGE